MSGKPNDFPSPINDDGESIFSAMEAAENELVFGTSRHTIEPANARFFRRMIGPDGLDIPMSEAGFGQFMYKYGYACYSFSTPATNSFASSFIGALVKRGTPDYIGNGGRPMLLEVEGIPSIPRLYGEKVTYTNPSRESGEVYRSEAFEGLEGEAGTPVTLFRLTHIRGGVRSEVILRGTRDLTVKMYGIDNAFDMGTLEIQDRYNWRDLGVTNYSIAESVPGQPAWDFRMDIQTS